MSKIMIINAVICNYIDVVRFLISKKVDLDQTLNHKITALLFACQYDNYEIAKLLINNGANCKVKDKIGLDCLFYSCINNNLKLFNLLIKMNVNVKTNYEDNFNPLIYACKYNANDQIIRHLLKHIDINNKTIFGLTAFLFLCEYNKLCIIREVIENVNDINHFPKYENKSALIIACLNNYSELVNLLVKNGANVNLFKISYTYSPLSIAIYKNNSKIISTLIENGADVNINDYNDSTPLINAIKNGNLKIFKILLSHPKIDVNKRNIQKIPLYIIVHLITIKNLLNY